MAVVVVVVVVVDVAMVAVAARHLQRDELEAPRPRAGVGGVEVHGEQRRHDERVARRLRDAEGEGGEHSEAEEVHLAEVQHRNVGIDRGVAEEEAADPLRHDAVSADPRRWLVRVLRGAEGGGLGGGGGRRRDDEVREVEGARDDISLWWR